MSDEAYMLIETVGDERGVVLNRLREIEGVVSAHSVSGPYDIIVYARRPDKKG